MFSRCVGFILLALLAVSIEANQRQARQVSTVTRTSTTVTTKFNTVTSTTRTVCVNYVNATSACRRKRQFWIDTPIVLALDEELDPFAQQFLNPSPVLRSVPAAHVAIHLIDSLKFYVEQRSTDCSAVFPQWRPVPWSVGGPIVAHPKTIVARYAQSVPVPRWTVSV